jgi:hypothetical protein
MGGDDGTVLLPKQLAREDEAARGRGRATKANEPQVVRELGVCVRSYRAHYL